MENHQASSSFQQPNEEVHTLSSQMDSTKVPSLKQDTDQFESLSYFADVSNAFLEVDCQSGNGSLQAGSVLNSSNEAAWQTTSESSAVNSFKKLESEEELQSNVETYAATDAATDSGVAYATVAAVANNSALVPAAAEPQAEEAGDGDFDHSFNRLIEAATAGVSLPGDQGDAIHFSESAVAENNTPTFDWGSVPGQQPQLQQQQPQQQQLQQQQNMLQQFPIQIHHYELHGEFQNPPQNDHMQQQQQEQQRMEFEEVVLDHTSRLENSLRGNSSEVGDLKPMDRDQEDDRHTLRTPETILPVAEHTSEKVNEGDKDTNIEVTPAPSAAADAAASVVSKSEVDYVRQPRLATGDNQAQGAQNPIQFNEFECGLCGEIFMAIEQLADHLGDIHLPMMPFIQPDQSCQTASELSRRRAKFINSSSNVLVCCLRLDLRVDNEQETTSYRSHLSGRETFADNLVVVTTRDPDCRPKPMFECRRCQRMFSNRQEALQHSDCDRFKCSYCDYVCGTIGAKNSHEKKRHPTSAAAAAASASASASTSATDFASTSAVAKHSISSAKKSNLQMKAKSRSDSSKKVKGKKFRHSVSVTVPNTTDESDANQQQMQNIGDAVESTDSNLHALLSQQHQQYQQQQQQQQQHDEAMQAYNQMMGYSVGYDPQQYQLAAYQQANAFVMQQQQQQQPQYYYPQYQQVYATGDGSGAYYAVRTSMDDATALQAALQQQQQILQTEETNQQQQQQQHYHQQQLQQQSLLISDNDDGQLM